MITNDLTSLGTLIATQRARCIDDPLPPLAERIARLTALDRALKSARNDVRAALAADLGRPLAETDLFEILPVLAEIDVARRDLRRWAAPRRVPTPIALAGARSEVRSVPRGIVAIFSPSNLPVQLALAPLVAAIAAGNRAVVRVTERTPHSRAVVARIIADAFDPHEVACVGGDVALAEALANAAVDHIFFTGGEVIGRRVAATAAARGVSTTLELGGKSPAIVAPGADLGRAAERIAWGRCLNAGQACIAPDYALVDRPRASEFADLVAERMRAMYGRDPKRSPHLGRLIDGDAVRRLGEAIDASLTMGARIVCGGAREPDAHYMAPTVVADVAWNMPLMTSELFGPVLPVLAYDDLDATMDLMRARPIPLAMYLFPSDASEGERMAAASRSGHVAINDVAVQWANLRLPIGGLGASGWGSYHGEAGFRELSHARAVFMRSRFTLAPLFAPPFGPITRALIAIAGRLPN